jgi:hypothetical protein
MARRWCLHRKKVYFHYTSFISQRLKFCNRFYVGLGLKATIETIDNRGDFKTYMQNYAFARGSAPSRGLRREGPSDEGFVSYIYSQENVY